MKFNKVSSFDVSDFRGGGGGSEIAGARDRTLLQKIGFVDRDKGNPKHDLACLYLAEHREALRPYAFDDKREGPSEYELERHVTKGDGKYRTTIGFLDLSVMYTAGVDFVHPVRSAEHRCACECPQDHAYDKTCAYCKRVCPSVLFMKKHGSLRRTVGAVAVEVKIAPVSTGDLLRQLVLYREYASGPEYRSRNGYDLDAQYTWIVALAYDIDVTSAKALANANVHVIRLGAKFERWAAAQRNKKATGVPEV